MPRGCVCAISFHQSETTVLRSGRSVRKHGASTIYREQGKRLIAIKFGVRDRDLGGAVARPRNVRNSSLIPLTTASGAANSNRCRSRNPAAVHHPHFAGLDLHPLVFGLQSFLDAIVVFTNVFDVGVGGIWALYLTGTNFSVSAAVGFVSLFGIAIMEGLLMISYFNGCALRDFRYAKQLCREPENACGQS